MIQMIRAALAASLFVVPAIGLVTPVQAQKRDVGLAVADHGSAAQQGSAPGSSRPAAPRVGRPNLATANGGVCIEQHNDLDGNGGLDAGEPPLGGWQYDVKYSNGGPYTAVGQWTTDATGRYCSGLTLPPGTYMIIQVQKPGWTVTQPTSFAPAGTDINNVNPGASTTFPYLNHAATPVPNPGRVCVTKYHDVDGDGIRDPGEPTMSGWQFSIRNGANVIVASGQTNGSGQYCSPNLPPATYNVRETLMPNWFRSSPSSATGRSVTVTSAQTINTDFGNYRPTQVCAEKYRDVNGNGTRDSGEPMIAGVTFTIYNGATVVATGVTAASGIVCFSVAPGTYRAVETLQAGWTNTDPGNATLDKVVTVHSGGTGKPRFGNRPVPTGFDLKVDTAFNKAAPPNPQPYRLGIFISSAQPIPAGSQLVVQGSLTPAGLFTPTGSLMPSNVVSTGWICTGSWAAFHCSKTLGAPVTFEALQLETTYAPSSAGQTYTYVASVAMTNNSDSNPGNDSRTVTATLY